MKRSVKLICFVFLVMIISSLVILGINAASDEEDKGLFDTISDAFTDKIEWVVGSKNFEGDEINLSNPLDYFFTDGWKYLLFGVAIAFWMILFKFFAPRSESPSYAEVGPLAKYFIWVGLVLPIAYVILMGIPLLNRILQIITLEFLFVNKGLWGFLIRSLVIGTVLYFSPVLLEAYFKSEKKKELYHRALRKVAGEELNKIHLKR